MKIRTILAAACVALLPCAAGAQQFDLPTLNANAKNNPQIALPIKGDDSRLSYVTPQMFGAKGKATIVTTTATMSGKDLTVSDPIFSASDVGKVIGVQNAGATSTKGTVTAVALATPGVCTTLPGFNLSGGGGSYGSLSTIISINSASVNFGGSGYPPGSDVRLKIVAASGTPAEVSVTVSAGGAVTAVNSVTDPGSFVVRTPFTTSQATTTTGSGSGALINLTSENIIGIGVNYGGGGTYDVSGTTAVITGGACTTTPVPGAVTVNPSIAPLASTIQSYVSPTHVVLADAVQTGLGYSLNLEYGWDDTAAFNQCAAAGKCFVPDDIYIVSGVTPPNGGVFYGSGSLVGRAGEVASGAKSAASQTNTPARPVLMAAPAATNIFNLLGVKDVSVKGMFLDCAYSNGGDGISSGSTALRADHVTIARCAHGIGSTTSSDLYTHGFRGDDLALINNPVGISNTIDGKVVGGSAASNTIAVSEGAGSSQNDFIGFRNEFNNVFGYYCFQCTGLRVTGELIDRNGTAGAYISQGSDIAFTGVQFRRNGSNNDLLFLANSHVITSGSVTNIVFNGSTFTVGVKDDGTGTNTPKFIITHNTDAIPGNIGFFGGSAVSASTVGFSAGNAPSNLQRRGLFGQADNEAVSNGPAISAAGTTLGTATALTLDINTVSTVASGAGVALRAWGATTGVVAPQRVINAGANALLVYPPVAGSAIWSNGTPGSAGAAVSLAAGAQASFICESAALCRQGP